MFPFSTIQKKNKSRAKKLTVLLILVSAFTLVVVGTVWAIAPPSAFGYMTVCHKAGTPDQETLILRERTARGHIQHGDPQAQCAAPLPDTAFGVPIDPDKGYLVDEIVDGSGIYWVTEGVYQVMFVSTGEGIIVVDAPPSMGRPGNPGEFILNAIAEVTAETGEEITHVIYSHSHADHIGAAAIYPDDAIYIAHEQTAIQLERERPKPFGEEIPYGIFVGGGPVPLPTDTFSDEYILQVGDQTLELIYLGPNHDPGNIYIYAPEHKVLMLIDVIFPGWSPFKALAVSEDVPGYFKAHDDVLSFDFDYLVSGHLGRLGTREDVETQQDYMIAMQQNAVLALSTVDFNAIAADVGFGNPWQLFDTYLDEVSQTCAELTQDEWLGRLGGVDVFTFSHCDRVVESLRID